MYQPGSHSRKVAQDSSSTVLLRCMPLFFSREGFSRSFPSPTMKSNFVYLRFNRSLFVWHFYFYFYFLVRENPSYDTGIGTHVPTCLKVARLPTEQPGQPATTWKYLWILCVDCCLLYSVQHIPYTYKIKSKIQLALRLVTQIRVPGTADHERDWPPCKVVFRVDNQYAECKKQQQFFFEQ